MLMSCKTFFVERVVQVVNNQRQRGERKKKIFLAADNSGKVERASNDGSEFSISVGNCGLRLSSFVKFYTFRRLLTSTSTSTSTMTTLIKPNDSSLKVDKNAATWTSLNLGCKKFLLPISSLSLSQPSLSLSPTLFPFPSVTVECCLPMLKIKHPENERERNKLKQMLAKQLEAKTKTLS